MIRFLQRQRAKKGFTIVELIVVIAIMGVLMAVILPQIMSKRSVINSANSAARDFYAAMQSVMTKFSLYEGSLLTENEEEIKSGKQRYCEMRYFEKMNGNYPFKKGATASDVPATASLYVELVTENNEVKDVFTYVMEGSESGYADGAGLLNLCKRASENKNTDFGELLKSEIEGRISYQDGFYYAKVTYKNGLTPTIPAKVEAETVKVEYTGYSSKRLPVSYSWTFTDYKNKVMHFKEANVLENGSIFGTCASYNSSAKKAVGDEGTYLS